MKYERISQSGITLIALIITIIVMLILVAVTVNIAVQSGLFGHAKNATQTWAEKEVEESNIGNDNYIKDAVNQNKGNQTNPDKEPDSKPDRTGLSVGDYVDYTPDTASNYMGLGTSTSEKAGSPNNLSGGIPQDKNLKWRILSINESGTVDIISDTPTATAVYLQGSIGYNNGVYLLNDLCASLYSNSTLGVKARSINLIDIENKLSDAGKNARDTYTTSKGIPYGNTQTYTGTVRTPDIYKQVGKTIEEESKDLAGVGVEKSLKLAKHLDERNIPVWIRHVLIPGITDTKENLEALGEFVSKLNNVERFEFLPYHSLGVHKWEAMGLNYELKNIEDES